MFHNDYGKFVNFQINVYAENIIVETFTGLLEILTKDKGSWNDSFIFFPALFTILISLP